MSTDWLSQPLSIQSIASQYTLPLLIRSALGLRGSDRPIIFHSIATKTYAFGRALKRHRSGMSDYQSFRPIDSEIVAVPLAYPGYFECLLPTSRGLDDGVLPEKSIPAIVEQMQVDYRSQAFYIAAPLRVYTLEQNSNGEYNRLWEQIEAHQIILFEQVNDVEYTPTENDELTADDYDYAWLFCFSRRILKRQELGVKCILSNDRVCYIPCSSTDEICLYPVGQRGSTNVYKLQTIENLLEKFTLPINIKLAQFPGCEAYRDFSGQLQLLGSQTEEFAVCASSSSINIALIPVSTPLKFVVAPVPLKSDEIDNQLSRCQIFLQSFDQQIRRILIASHEITPHHSRSKHQSGTSGKRSMSVDQPQFRHEEQGTSIENDGHSGPSTEKRRTGFRKSRATSTNDDERSPHHSFRRTLSTGDNITYNSLVHRVRPKDLLKQSTATSPSSSSSSRKRAHPSRLSTPFTYDSGSNLANALDLPDANGAILLDDNALLLPVKTDHRLS